MMNNYSENIDCRLSLLGQQLAEQPSVIDRVMGEIDLAGPVRVLTRRDQGALNKVLNLRNLIAVAAVLALVFAGLDLRTKDQGDKWWFAQSGAWAAELRVAVEKAGQQGFSCQERLVSLVGIVSKDTDLDKLYVAGNRYRRDIYDQGQLQESQWYVHGTDGLKMTSIRYLDKTYTVTLDPQAHQQNVDPLTRMETLTQLLGESGQHIGSKQIEEQDAVGFSIESKKLDPRDDAGTVIVWLDKATKMPLRIEAIVGAWIYEQNQFDWNPTLPADTLEPQIPAGFAKLESAK
jgi:hypothetical protein